MKIKTFVSPFLLLACILVSCDDAPVQLNDRNLPGAPQVILEPDDVSAFVGETATFRVKVSGDPGTVFQWFMDIGRGIEKVPGAHDETLVIDSVTAALDEARYKVTAINSKGVAHSREVTLSVRSNGPAITLHPQRITTCGEEAIFTAAAGGSSEPAVQWQVNDFVEGWKDLPGETNPTLKVKNADYYFDMAEYRAVFSNAEGTSISRPATHIAGYAPIIEQQPGDGSIQAGIDLTFTVKVDSYPLPEYQWQLSNDGGNTWKNARYGSRAEYTFSDIKSIHDGVQIRVVCSNDCGSRISRAATLRVF